jgi:hypothetical protein
VARSGKELFPDIRARRGTHWPAMDQRGQSEDSIARCRLRGAEGVAAEVGRVLLQQLAEGMLYGLLKVG